jgi:CBS domain-containing protein
MERIDQSGLQIAIITKGERNLKGVVTDGDIRRGILRGVDLDAPVRTVMNEDPITARPQEERQSLIDRMRSRRIHQLPLVDRHGHIMGIEVLDELLELDS